MIEILVVLAAIAVFVVVVRWVLQKSKDDRVVKSELTIHGASAEEIARGVKAAVNDYPKLVTSAHGGYQPRPGPKNPAPPAGGSGVRAADPIPPYRPEHADPQPDVATILLLNEIATQPEAHTPAPVHHAPPVEYSPPEPAPYSPPAEVHSTPSYDHSSSSSHHDSTPSHDAGSSSSYDSGSSGGGFDGGSSGGGGSDGGW